MSPSCIRILSSDSYPGVDTENRKRGCVDLGCVGLQGAYETPDCASVRVRKAERHRQSMHDSVYYGLKLFHLFCKLIILTSLH